MKKLVSLDKRCHYYTNDYIKKLCDKCINNDEKK